MTTQTQIKKKNSTPRKILFSRGPYKIWNNIANAREQKWEMAYGK